MVSHMRMETQSSIVEQNSLIATQIADFANDKILYHKFLEEVSDRKILLQQTAQESFNLVQIMVKAGLQLIENDGSFDSTVHESLFSKSLSALSFLLSDNTEILYFQSQYETPGGIEELWAWLLGKFDSLLHKKLSSNVSNAVSDAVLSLLCGLKRDFRRHETFWKAVHTILMPLRTRQSAQSDRSCATGHFGNYDHKVMVQVRVCSVIVSILMVKDELHFLTGSVKLVQDVLAFLKTTVVVWKQWTNTSNFDDAFTSALMTTARSAASPPSLAWLSLTQDILGIWIVPPRPVGESPKSQPNHKNVINVKNAAIESALSAILSHLSTWRTAIPRDIDCEIRQIYQFSKDNTLLVSENSLRLISRYTNTSTMPEKSDKVASNVAMIFRKRQIDVAPHPIVVELQKALETSDAVMKPSDLFRVAQDRFNDFALGTQCLLLRALGLACCAAASKVSRVKQHVQDLASFICSECHEEYVRADTNEEPILDFPSHVAREVLLELLKKDVVKSNTILRVELLKSWRCMTKHALSYEVRDINNPLILKYISSSLEDNSRQIRICAGQLLVEHFRYGDRQIEEDVYQFNRKRIFDMLRRHVTNGKLSESLINTWTNLGLAARPDDLQLVLITLVDCLCNANMFIRQTTIASLNRLAAKLERSTYMLFSPYMRHISAQVLDRSNRHAGFLPTFSRILGITAAEFLSRNQQYLLPLMVLHSLQDHIQAIADVTKRSVKEAILDNIPFILSSLLTSGYNKDGGLMRFLAAADDSFQTITLDELVNSYPIPLAVELLQLLADSSVKRESVMAALSQVAHICSKVHSATRKTPRDMALDNLKEFLHKHSLGIVSQCEESMNGFRGKRGILDRIRYINAIGELILLLQQGIEYAVPQITAFLQTAMSEDGLRFSALNSWDGLICVVSEEVAMPLIPYTVCLFQSVWTECNDNERKRIKAILDNILEDHQTNLARQIGQIPRLRIPELRNIEEKFAGFRSSTGLTTRLKQVMQLTSSDNPVICEEGLRELRAILQHRQADIHVVILKDWRDPALHETLRCLLDITAKFRGFHEPVQLLAAECLGIIGAIDPVRQDASKKYSREVILHNFEDADAEESVKFVRIFLESQLVNAFRSATRSNVQIFLAWAIQELLKFSGFDESVIAMTDQRGIIHDVEAKKRWRMFTPAARDVMTPLLSSKYDAGHRLIKLEVHYPIINDAQTYNSWLYLFLSDLLQSAAGENAKKLFSVFSRILREEETIISNFLLPYVFLNVCVGCSEDKRTSLLLEIVTVLQLPLTTDVYQTEYVRLARESVFSIIDYISLWTRSRRIYNRDRLAEKLKRQNRHMFPEDEHDKDLAIKIVQDLMNQIPDKLMAEAALSCGSYSRALFYWEQHIRFRKSDKKFIKEEQEALYAQLQQLYININDPDGIEGVSSCLTDMTLEQEIMMHENAGRWTSAQSSYELALRSMPPTDDLRVGLLNCLKQTGHHDVLLDQAIRYLQMGSKTEPRILDLAIESSWSLAQWTETRSLLSRATHTSYDVLLGRSILKMVEQDDLGYAKAILELKRKVANDLGLSNMDSTWQCYDSLAKLAVIYELECKITGPEHYTTPLPPAILRDRLLVMPTTSHWKQHLLAVRRTLLQPHSSPASVSRAISSIWLESAKLARKAGQGQQAYKAILNALYSNNGTPLAKIEHARWWWKEGHQIRAIQTLQKALENNVFDGYEPESHDSTLSLDASLINSGKSPKAALISKAELLLTRWTDLAEHTNSKQQLKEYANASRGSQMEKPHYFMGRYFLRLLEAETKKSPDLQDHDFIRGEYHRQVVMSYGRAMHFGVKYIFQTLPSYLQLWLDFGQEVRTVHQKAATTNQKRQDLIALRISHLAHMNEKIKGFVHRLPTYLYMLAFPQILSRINHQDKGCYSLLENMILKCLMDYPKQALWPFMAVCKSRDSLRSSRGNTLVGRLRKEATKQGNSNLSRLSMDAQNLTDQLMHLCTVPVIKNRASLSLSRDLEFNMHVAPSNLVVPIQNNLTVILPAQGGVGSTKHHRAFDENQPTIASFKDEVDVMASLQKPRKITIRASDGQSYPFLVKPNDDLRKDARLMDFNGVVQKFIRKDPEALKRLMKIRTYAVIALNEDHGLCEWVRNTRPLRDILVKTYAGRNISMQYAEVKTRLEQCLVAANPGQAFEVHILKMFPPSFHDWFVEKFADPAQWFAARLSYSRTLAVMSMVGFVLGLGDRHGENILFDETTGDAVHVDFNCLFEKGHTFDKPERVPFRLTHNMVDALGVTGVEGAFRKTCEITLRILRTNQDAFNTVLESFLHDPVAEFLKKVKKSPTGEFEKAEAIKVLSVIANKLKGSAGTGAADKHIPLSVGGQADELIKQATDPRLLVQMYIGWTAWL